MSYLDVPRLHFMGLFYSAPGNLNNLIDNFDLEKTLDYDTGLYKYPDGTAQLYLSNCVVTSVVGTDGAVVTDPQKDALVGAAVTSPSPNTPKPDDKGGLYGLAKLVDLDPNMQFRSEVYGLRIYVDIPGGGGFSGLLAVQPQLRDLWFVRGNAGINGLQVAVGTWHQRLTDLVWTEPSKSSPVFDALRARSAAGLDVKMGVDMFQTNRQNEFTQGDRFGYGRLVATIGGSSADEPLEVVPGRRLYTPATFATPSLAVAAGQSKIELTRQAAEEAVSGVNAAASDWNRTDFRICNLPGGRSLLIADLFNSAALAPGLKGQFITGSKLAVGWLDDQAFTALTNGVISLDGYTGLDSATRKLKDIVWPDGAAVVQIELTAAERQKLANTPVAIQSDGTTVLRENPNGLYINSERPSIRMEPLAESMIDVWSFQFGEPSAALPPGLKVQVLRYDDESGTASPTTIFKISLGVNPIGPGHFPLSIKTGPAVPLTDIRKPLDSFLCFVDVWGSDYLVGEAMKSPGPPTPAFVSLLFWQNHRVVARPQWDANIQPLMAMYARLFPGMVNILDISDLPTVKGFAAVLKDRFQRMRDDPGFMPVSRDMSPATVDMVVRFLDGLSQEGQS